MVPDGRVLITYKNIFFTFDKKVFAVQKYYKNIDLDFYLQFLLLPVLPVLCIYTGILHR